MIDKKYNWPIYLMPNTMTMKRQIASKEEMEALLLHCVKYFDCNEY